MELPPKVNISWRAYYRIISSRFPPIDLFERIAQPDEYRILAEIEALTNPRIRAELGKISNTPSNRHVYGNGASYNMAPFAHFSSAKPSRFSDGKNYGVFYGAKTFETALKEVVFVRQKFYSATENYSLEFEERVLQGEINAQLFDVRGDNYNNIHDPNDYSASQMLGALIRKHNGDGIVYRSVRNEGGENFAAFWPNVMGIPKQTKHLKFHWNGKKVDKYFDFKDQKWIKF